MLEFAGILTGAISGLLNTQKNNKRDKFYKELLDHMTKMSQNQSDLLGKMISNMEALKNGPFYSAITHLKDAAKPHRTEEESNDLVETAKKRFVDAEGILQGNHAKGYQDHFQMGVIRTYISLCWLLLDKLWNIKLNQQISFESIHNQSVYVEDDAGQRVTVTPVYNSGSNTILVQPPEEGYQPNTTSYIFYKMGC